MSEWRHAGRKAVNGLAALVGLRVVSASWGPRGAFDTLRRMRSHGLAPALIFDVGASNGQWTRACLELYPDSHYVLVEPLARNHAALADLAHASRQVTIVEGAAGASSGTLDLFDHGDQSSALASEEYAGPRTTVPVTTIDALFEAHRPAGPVLLKADVQGYELEVLRGASRSLAACEVLLLEVSYRRLYQDSALAHEIIGYVAGHGFRIYDICSYLQRPADRELVQSDIVFVHESSPLFLHQGWSKPG